MPIIYDARGNEFQGQLDQIGGGVITDARVASGLLAASNAELVMDINGKDLALFDLRTAAMSATLVFEVSLDETNYFGLPAMNLMTEAMLAAVIITTTQATIFAVKVSGWRRVRVRVSSYTSGNITVTGRASISQSNVYARPIPSTIGLTATGAVNAAVTATLAAGGAGLFHYITLIELRKLYNVIGVAAGAGVIITSTNLVGTPAWTTEQEAKAAGTVEEVIKWFAHGNPIKSTNPNIATTFVAPAQLETIWRWNIQYYLGA